MTFYILQFLYPFYKLILFYIFFINVFLLILFILLNVCILFISSYSFTKNKYKYLHSQKYCDNYKKSVP